MKEEHERIYYDKHGFIALNIKKMRKYITEMIRNADKDSKQYYRYKNIIGDSAGSLAGFRQKKYNNPKKFKVLKKKADTYSEINKKGWFEEFKQKSKDAYNRFAEKGIYMSTHALSRLPRLNRAGYPEVSESELIKFIHADLQYTEGENKLVYFNSDIQLGIIKNKMTEDIVSLIRRKRPKEVWKDV